MLGLNKAGRTFGAGAVAMSFAAGAMASKASGGVYLVGSAEYVTSITISGGTGANSFGYYRRSSNSTDVGNLPISPGTASNLSVPLSTGNNNFTFSPSIDQGLSIDRNAAAMFFFNTTGVSYNPTYVSGPGIAGDLVVWAPAGTSSFQTPAAGTQVLDYYGASGAGAHSYLASYSGATSVLLGDDLVTITAFTAGNNTTTGPNTPDLVTIHVEHLPEPASLGFVAAAGGAMLMRRQRRPRTEW